MALSESYAKLENVLSEMDKHFNTRLEEELIKTGINIALKESLSTDEPKIIVLNNPEIKSIYENVKSHSGIYDAFVISNIYRNYSILNNLRDSKEEIISGNVDSLNANSYASSLLAMAYDQIRRNRFDDVEPTLNLAHDLIEKVGGKNKEKLKAKLNLRLSIYYLKKGDYSNSNKYGKIALDISKNINSDYLIAESYKTLASAVEDDEIKSEEYNLKAIDILTALIEECNKNMVEDIDSNIRNITKAKKSISSAYNNIGVSKHRAIEENGCDRLSKVDENISQKLTEITEYYTKGIETAKSIDDWQMIGWSSFNIAEVLALQKKFEESQIHIEEAEDIFKEKMGGESSIAGKKGLSGVYMAYGVLYTLKGEAKKEAFKAEELIRKGIKFHGESIRLRKELMELPRIYYGILGRGLSYVILSEKKNDKNILELALKDYRAALNIGEELKNKEFVNKTKEKIEDIEELLSN